jgi:hypothetical protein
VLPDCFLFWNYRYSENSKTPSGRSSMIQQWGQHDTFRNISMTATVRSAWYLHEEILWLPQWGQITSSGRIWWAHGNIYSPCFAPRGPQLVPVQSSNLQLYEKMIYSERSWKMNHFLFLRHVLNRCSFRDNCVWNLEFVTSSSL